MSSIKQWIQDNYTNYGTYVVKNELVPKFRECRNKIFELLETNKPVPPYLLKRAIVLFKDEFFLEESLFAKRFKGKRQELVAKAVAYFADYEDYQVSGTYKTTMYHFDPDSIWGDMNENETSLVDSPYSLSLMIDSVFRTYLLYELDEKSFTKNKAVSCLYSEIDAYIEHHFSKAHKRKYKKYKRYVVAGYLAMCAGHRLFDIRKKQYNNNDIYHAVYDIFREKKPPKSTTKRTIKAKRKKA